jgi:putative sterol carrier protein
MHSHDEYLTPAQDMLRGWEGSLVCILTAQPEIGIDNDLGIYIELTSNTCEVRAATATELTAAGVALRATSGTWGNILAGHLQATDALMNDQITIQRGNRDTLHAGLETFQGLLDAPDELSAELFPLLRDALLPLLQDTLARDATDAGASAPEEQGVRYLTVVHDEVDAEFEDARLEALIAVFEHWRGKLHDPVRGGVRRGRDHTTFSIGAPGQAEMFLPLETIARALDPGWWQIRYATH